MFDTYVTIVGNVLTAPEWRRTTQSGTLVANFKVASTARRLDRESRRWVDGNSLRVRVNCWRKLAEGVASSVMVGDPVVVVGRLYTRDWTDDAGNHRTMYELEAVAVGHDLSRGRGRFARNRPTTSTSSMDDAEAEARVHGEATESVPLRKAPALPDERPIDDDGEYRGLPLPPSQGSDSAHGFDSGSGFEPGRDFEPALGYESSYVPPDAFDGRIDLDGLPSGEVTGPDEDASSTTDPWPAAEDHVVQGVPPAGNGIDADLVGDEDRHAPDSGSNDGSTPDTNSDGNGTGGGGRGRRGRSRTPVSV